ncbi:MAG: DUF6290 family protein [Coriobacteriia bacterium]|nr:DUF6290 family protein [Coriobacteriia bacterium]
MGSDTLTIRLDSTEKELLAKYAKAYGCSISEFVRKSALERIEDELDLQAWDEAKAEYEKDPVSFSLQEIMDEFGIS